VGDGDALGCGRGQQRRFVTVGIFDDLRIEAAQLDAVGIP
jgi:hypothetical protein